MSDLDKAPTNAPEKKSRFRAEINRHKATYLRLARVIEGQIKEAKIEGGATADLVISKRIEAAEATGALAVLELFYILLTEGGVFE
jgi:hypothetical protein